ncbi:LysR substrate-binding domain-containing protein [Ideonella livida]|uniref:LysR family transcriptional regulator n=2 Tax=Ideonella livida TaxID=2707176 RepID=A0A7C9TJK9_9BURK|nr:LysR family transcriptional regulator [Ideonella livida]
MNFKQLEYFVTVAELGSFSKAAVALDIAQPALSRQVRALEVELRETLLLRNGRGVSLTETGEQLFEHATAILRQVALAREDLGANREEPVGRITLGLPPSMSRQLTLPLIDTFQRQLPKARLAVVEGLSSHIGEWITSGRVDIGLLYNPEANPGLEVCPLLQEPLCLVERDDGRHGAQDLAPLPFSALAGRPLVLPERQHVIRRLLDNQATLVGVRLDIAWEVSSVASIIDLVCAGYGHAVLTASGVAASGRQDALRVRPVISPSVQTVLCLATSAHRRSSNLMRHACDLLQGLVAGLPQGSAAQSLPG